VEGEHPSIGVVRKDMGKGFRKEYFQSVLKAQKRIQNPCRQWLQNVIMQTVDWENPYPIHYMVIMVGEFTHCHLRYLPRFCEGRIQHKGKSHVTLGGNEVESESMEVKPL
jgi:hypothetical protein